MRDADENVDMFEADVVVLLCLMYCTPDGAQSLSLYLSYTPPLSPLLSLKCNTQRFLFNSWRWQVEA